MFFSDWRVLLRRWYTVLIGLVLTAGMCVGVAQVVPPSYQIKAMILVLPPRNAVGTGGNPFLGLGGLGSVADVVSRSMMDGNTVQSLVQLGANDKYLVAQDVTSAGPVILITSTGSTPQDADNTLRIVKSQLPDKLLKLQQATHVPDNSLITLSQISQDEKPAIARKSQIRALFGVFALGMTLTLILTGFLDGLLLRRRRQRNGEEVPFAGPPLLLAPQPGSARQPSEVSDGRYPRPVQQNQPVARFAQPSQASAPTQATPLTNRMPQPANQPSNRSVPSNGRPAVASANGHTVATNGYPSPAPANGRPAPAPTNDRPMDSHAYPIDPLATQPNGHPVESIGRSGQLEQNPAQPAEKTTGRDAEARRPAKGSRIGKVFDLDRLPVTFREAASEQDQEDSSK